MKSSIVDQFAGPGGWDLAARWLGLDDPLGIENDDAACATREAAGLRTLKADIRTVEPIRAVGLISSPPCPTFSAAGKGSGRKELPVVIDLAKRLVKGEDWRELTAGLEDERTGLVLEPLHWIHAMHEAGTPYRWVAMEQVPSVLPLWEVYAELLREMGYSAWAGKLTSEMYGVPQTRIRAILVASLDREVTAPPPTHSKFYSRDRTRLDSGVRKWVSMAEALGWGMTERPYPVLAMSRTTGGPDREKVGGSGARKRIYAERDAGRWVVRTSYGEPKVDGRNGTHTFDPENRPSHVVTTKTGDWVVQPIPEGMVTVKGEGMLERAGQQQSQRSIDEPALTMTGAEGGGSHRHRWMFDRPATTVQGDPRIWPPGHKINEDDRRRLGDEADERYRKRSSDANVRISYIEAAILQGFPADYPWQGTKTKKHQQIGNAIPPPLACHVLAMATGISIAINNGTGDEEAMTEQTEQQQPPAPPEKWLTPKISRQAKEYAVSLGHLPKRVTIRGDEALSGCKRCDDKVRILREEGSVDVQMISPAGELGDFRCGEASTGVVSESGVTTVEQSYLTPETAAAVAQAREVEADVKRRLEESRAGFDARNAANGMLMDSEAPVYDPPPGMVASRDEAQTAAQHFMGLYAGNSADSSPVQPTSQSVLIDGGGRIAEAVAGANDMLMGDATGGWTAPSTEQLYAQSQVTYDPNVAPGVMQQPPAVRWTMPPPLPMTPVLDPLGNEWDPFAELIGMIERFTDQSERSQQKLIGPSEIGLDCDRCLAKKLLQVPMNRETAWLPTIGTAVHAWLEKELRKCGEDCGWISERKVPIGIIGNRLIKGTCDAFKNGVVVDFKIVGDSTLKKVASHGASGVYRGQGHSYGRGYELEGYDVTHIMVLYLPRNAPSLSAAKKHIEPYSRGIAADVLARAQQIYDLVTADPSMVIKLPRAADCYDCYRFAPLPGEDQALGNQPRAGQPFAGILPS